MLAICNCANSTLCWLEAVTQTSTGIQQLGPLDKAQVAGASPQGVGLPEAEARVEVVGLQTLLPIDGIVSTGTVGTGHPDLTERGHKTRP